jgi:hypothetical protein
LAGGMRPVKRHCPQNRCGRNVSLCFASPQESKKLEHELTCILLYTKRIMVVRPHWISW